MGSPASRENHSGELKPYAALRVEMVERNIAARGVRDDLVLDAMRKVPRELFLPKNLREFAYEDSPLPIAGEQTISQPYIVAFMAEALMLKGGEKVLEIGAGSGYAAAVLSEIAASVYTVERLGQLADKAAALLAELGYDNVHVLHGDGTKGWPEHAPYDAIVVAAGGPQVPESLKEQLKIGGRLVIPVGADQRTQELVRVVRVSKDEYRSEDIADVRFVPLIGEEGWEGAQGEGRAPARRAPRPVPSGEEALVRNLADAAESFSSIETADLNPLMQRIGSARIVLLGEATHGTSEFYRMRERITRDLIVKKGFRFVAIEADWPDAARVDHYVRHFQYPPFGVDRLCAVSDLDVAKHRGARFRQLAAQAQWHGGGGRARRLSWARSLQPLRFDPVGSELSRRGRSGIGEGGPRTLWLPDAVADAIPRPMAMPR